MQRLTRKCNLHTHRKGERDAHKEKGHSPLHQWVSLVIASLDGGRKSNKERNLITRRTDGQAVMQWAGGERERERVPVSPMLLCPSFPFPPARNFTPLARVQYPFCFIGSISHSAQSDHNLLCTQVRVTKVLTVH